MVIHLQQPATIFIFVHEIHSVNFHRIELRIFFKCGIQFLTKPQFHVPGEIHMYSTLNEKGQTQALFE